MWLITLEIPPEITSIKVNDVLTNEKDKHNIDLEMYAADPGLLKLITTHKKQSFYKYPIVRVTELVRIQDMETSYKRYYVIKGTFDRFIKDAMLIPRTTFDESITYGK